MATTFKTFLNNDIASTRTLLHEAIPITGSIVSGTYTENNIKNYAHGMFQSVYDYPYLSSSANHIFDVTVGISSGSAFQTTTSAGPATEPLYVSSQFAKKRNIYDQMAQVLVPYSSSGQVQRFDQDGNIVAGGGKINEAFFLNFSRLLQKDEIKKGSFSVQLGGQEDPLAFPADILTITDDGAENEFRVNSAVGEYGLLSCSLGGGYVDGNNIPVVPSDIQMITAQLCANALNDMVRRRLLPDAYLKLLDSVGKSGASNFQMLFNAPHLFPQPMKDVCENYRITWTEMG